jgi:hypothetical protein
MYLLFALFAAYAINISVLVGSISYITYSFLSKQYLQIENPLLAGWRLWLALLLTVLWIIYVFIDLLNVLNYLNLYYAKIDMVMITDKLIRESIDCAATILNVILLTGKGIKK